jgi:hypothetical protein
MSHPLYICKHNLQAEMNKTDCGLIIIFTKLEMCMSYYVKHTQNQISEKIQNTNLRPRTIDM